MTRRQTAGGVRHRSAEPCPDLQRAPPGMTPDPPDREFRSIQVEHAGSAECILRRSMRWGVRQGCALHLLRAGATATATAEATAEAGFLWGVGVGPVAGDAVNPSPQSDTAPPSHRQPRAALALALALAVAGQRPALPRVQGAALPTHPPLRTKTISLFSANRHPFATPVPYCAAACAHGRPVLKIARPSLRSIQERHCDGRELGEQQQDVPGHTRGALPPTWRHP
jgi:hypothetical protein